MILLLTTIQSCSHSITFVLASVLTLGICTTESENNNNIMALPPFVILWRYIMFYIHQMNLVNSRFSK